MVHSGGGGGGDGLSIFNFSRFGLNQIVISRTIRKRRPSTPLPDRSFIMVTEWEVVNNFKSDGIICY